MPRVAKSKSAVVERFDPARLRQAREDRGLSRERLGRQTGYSSAHVHDIERGRAVPSIVALIAICAELDLRVGDVFVEAGE